MNEPPSVNDAILAALPLYVEVIDWSFPVLNVRGSDWILAGVFPWRLVDRDGLVTSGSLESSHRHLRNLVGTSIVGVSFDGETLLDPRFHFETGLFLEVFSDEAYDTWTLRVPTLFIAGPLLESDLAGTRNVSL